VAELSEPEESKFDDNSALLKFDDVQEDLPDEWSWRLNLDQEYSTNSNSNFLILNKH